MVGQLANALSALRIFLTPFFIWFMFDGPEALIISVIIFTLAALTDSCDGYIARRFKTVSEFGIFLDPIADKILMFGVFGSFFVLGFVPLWFLVVLIVRDVVITLLRTIMKSTGASLVTSSLGKIKTFTQVITIYGLFTLLFIQKFPSLYYLHDSISLCVSILLYAVAVMTIYSAADYVIKNWQRIVRILKG